MWPWGDAPALSLERESPENFDVLAVDAFSSDSIPVAPADAGGHEAVFQALAAGRRAGGPHFQPLSRSGAGCSRGRPAATGKMARVVDTDDDDTQDIFGANLGAPDL